LTHRDIKLGNIFLARVAGMEIPKVLDFGVAKLVSSSATTQSINQTGAGELVGTLRYMSPEQLRGEFVAATWDLWALAIVAYEMLAGKYPFEGATDSEWQLAVMTGRFTPVGRYVPTAPPAWQEFFCRALAVQQERRPPAASVFFSELEGALAG
jgi:serine/threonine-protein kinase